MQARRRALKRLAAVLLFGAGIAAAQASFASSLPSPANCSVPARIVICPAGDSVMIVVSRDLANNPILGSEVVLEVCGCPGFRLSSQQAACDYPDTVSCQVAMLTDSQGIVEIPVAGGGLCPGGTVRIYVSSLLIATRPEPACFDQNGDLRVDSTDVAIVQSKLGTADPGADFDGDGVVTAQDVAILLQHLGHAAADAMPAGPQAVWRDRRGAIAR